MEKNNASNQPAIKLISDKRERHGRNHRAELKLRRGENTINVTLWGRSPAELEEKVQEFLGTGGSSSNGKVQENGPK